VHHYKQGLTTTQAHKAIPDGHFEEEQGLKGFFGPVSHLIRKKPSTRWTHIEGDLRPHLYDLPKLPSEEGYQRLLFNAQVSIGLCWKVPNEKDWEAYRNADGDLLYFCHQGSGKLLSEYGCLEYRAGHYVVVPKCVAHTFLPSEKSCLLVVENRTSHYEEPERGMVGRHAVYDPNAIVMPNLEAQISLLQGAPSEVLTLSIKHGDAITKYHYAEEFYDVVGWKGDLYPYTLHVDDMMPLMSHRAHLPPSAHSTFVARDFVVCTFLPRPLEEDKDALKVPFYHQNIDYDEVLFYHRGDFFSRDNLEAGMMSFHPAGFAHGPHPKAIEAVESKTHTDEYAVMVDTRWPLEQDPILKEVEVANYWKSWQSK
jgi:homogentisate 1,2-dioxygenase